MVDDENSTTFINDEEVINSSREGLPKSVGPTKDKLSSERDCDKNDAVLLVKTAGICNDDCADGSNERSSLPDQNLSSLETSSQIVEDEPPIHCEQVRLDQASNILQSISDEESNSVHSRNILRSLSGEREQLVHDNIKNHPPSSIPVRSCPSSSSIGVAVTNESIKTTTNTNNDESVTDQEDSLDKKNTAKEPINHCHSENSGVSLSQSSPPRQNIFTDETNDFDWRPFENSSSPHPPQPSLQHNNLELYRQLDDEYERAIEEAEISWQSRYTSVRETAVLSAVFMFLYLLSGCAFYSSTMESTSDALFFIMYTITTVGYGVNDIPNSAEYQAFTIFYIMVGIAAITVLAAQVYQCIILEATKVQNHYDDGIGDDTDDTDRAEHPSANIGVGSPHKSSMVYGFHMEEMTHTIDNRPIITQIIDYYKTVRVFLKHTSIGRVVAAFLPFISLILAGSIVVGSVEGWTPLESFYWSFVTLTTIGYGDFIPKDEFSKWFCIIFYFPGSIFFMSYYLALVAKSYIHANSINIARLERKMRNTIRDRRFEMEQALISTQGIESQIRLTVEDSFLSKKDGENISPLPQALKASMIGWGGGTRNNVKSSSNNTSIIKEINLIQPPDADNRHLPASQASKLVGQHNPNAIVLLNNQGDGDDGRGSHRETILENFHAGNSFNTEKSPIMNVDGGDAGVGQYHCKSVTSSTMKGVLESLRSDGYDQRRCSSTSRRNSDIGSSNNTSQINSRAPVPHSSIAPDANTASKTIEMNTNGSNSDKTKPSFALRAIVQERMSQIIAADVAGFQSFMLLQNNTFSITIDALTSILDKWMIPRRARKAFRSVAFQALLMVGEHTLITKGPDALLCLSPLEFHGIFNPFLAAMGDAETMELWLGKTDVLADVELLSN
mmetsp:Transcript_31010/g.37780  ORF Transcript_31010/g.37780 Transcript_31010/m.37780 type:complete len:899 (+) Transcript_31010:74-2770(+)